MNTANIVENAINHWLNSPPNNYFGLDYGSTVRDLLLTNLNAENADAFIDKMVVDIPMLLSIKPQINIRLDDDMQIQKIFIEIQNTVFLEIGEVSYG